MSSVSIHLIFASSTLACSDPKAIGELSQPLIPPPTVLYDSLWSEKQRESKIPPTLERHVFWKRLGLWHAGHCCERWCVCRWASHVHGGPGANTSWHLMGGGGSPCTVGIMRKSVCMGKLEYPEETRHEENMNTSWEGPHMCVRFDPRWWGVSVLPTLTSTEWHLTTGAVSVVSLSVMAIRTAPRWRDTVPSSLLNIMECL